MKYLYITFLLFTVNTFAQTWTWVTNDTIVENIQAQNKKNQLFLNKAMLSLQELKDSFSKQKTVTTYGPGGKTITKRV